jgi:hypothetical protein
MRTSKTHGHHPVLNKTKWAELRLAMLSIEPGSPPTYRIKNLDTGYLSDWTGNGSIIFKAPAMTPLSGSKLRRVRTSRRQSSRPRLPTCTSRLRGAIRCLRCSGSSYLVSRSITRSDGSRPLHRYPSIDGCRSPDTADDGVTCAQRRSEGWRCGGHLRPCSTP